MSINQALDTYVNRLPYENPSSVKVAVAAFLNANKSLSPSTGNLIFNDGTESRLLLLSGTIPIIFQRNQYNIPIDIFIPIKYPLRAPVVYVRPTQGMIVTPSHPNVSSDGLVQIPYLTEWRNVSSLFEMVNHLKSIFGQSPPLYTKPAVARVLNERDSHNIAVAQVLTNPQSIPTAAVTLPSNSIPLGVVATDHRYSGLTGSANMSGTLSSSKRQLLIESVTLKLQQELHQSYSKLTNDLDIEFSNEAKLTESGCNSALQLQTMHTTKLQLSSAIAEMKSKKEKLLTEMELWNSDEPIKVEDLLIAEDDLSEQTNSVRADSLAIDDALYYLNKALSADLRKSDVPSFMKEIRKLARQQFLTNALNQKIEKTF